MLRYKFHMWRIQINVQIRLLYTKLVLINNEVEKQLLEESSTRKTQYSIISLLADEKFKIKVMNICSNARHLIIISANSIFK